MVWTHQGRLFCDDFWGCRRAELDRCRPQLTTSGFEGNCVNGWVSSYGGCHRFFYPHGTSWQHGFQEIADLVSKRIVFAAWKAGVVVLSFNRFACLTSRVLHTANTIFIPWNRATQTECIFESQWLCCALCIPYVERKFMQKFSEQ